MTAPKHPARYTPNILAKIREVLPESGLVVDPFAGTGLIHDLATDTRQTLGIEIEPEWAMMRAGTLVADATALPLSNECAVAIATSPTYANRFADSHTARDGSTRRSYTHDLRALTNDPERRLHPNNTGQMHWGPKYKVMHLAAWEEAVRILKPGGVFVLNCKNHIKQFQEQQVTEWHIDTLRDLGLEVDTLHLVPVTGMGFGANGQSRAAHETVAVLVKP